MRADGTDEGVDPFADEPFAACCMWWAGCDREATRARWHPILGHVAICSECDHQIDVVEARTDARRQSREEEV